MTMTPEARVAVESFRAEALIGDTKRAETKSVAGERSDAEVTSKAVAASSIAASAALSAQPPAAPAPVAIGTAPRYMVTALGRQFRVSAEMAAIFLRQVERVVEGDSSALVVLRHEEGVELLLVTDDNSFSIHALPH